MDRPELPAGLIEARRQAAERRELASELRQQPAPATTAEMEHLTTKNGVHRLLDELEAKAKGPAPEVTTDTN